MRKPIGNKLESTPHLQTIDVDTGQIRVSADPATLQAIALGSCIALVVYERKKRIGGIAHIMLPGKSPSMKKRTRYAEDAIEELLVSTKKMGAEIDDVEISVVGGANVLQEGDIPERVLESVLDCLKKLRVELVGMRVGGIERRSAFLDTVSGDVFYTEGDSTTKRLLKRNV